MAESKRRPVGRPKGTGTQRVYSRVRENILTLAIAPGSSLDEASLEREFQVSRTPVREALIRLASEGLITLLPNRGARVTPIDVSDVAPLFEALELAQRATLHWCARRRTDDDIAELRRLGDAFAAAAGERDHDAMGEANRAFHAAVGDACGNRYVAGLYHSLLANSQRLARMVFAATPRDEADQDRYYRKVIRQHGAMVRAVEKGNAEAADRLARDHVALFRSRVVRYIEQTLADDVPIAD